MASNKINGDEKKNGLSNKDFNKGIEDDSTVTESALVDNDAIISAEDEQSSTASAEDEQSSTASAEDEQSSTASAEDEQSSTASAEDEQSSTASAEDEQSSTASAEDEQSSTASAQDESYARMIEKRKFDSISNDLQKIAEKSKDPVCKEMNARRLSELMIFHLPPTKGKISEQQVIDRLDSLEKRVKLNEDFVCEFTEYFNEIVSVLQHVETMGTNHLPLDNQKVILINLLIVRQEITLKIKWLNIVKPNLERALGRMHTIRIPDSPTYFNRLCSLSQRVEMTLSPLKSLIETLGKYETFASTTIACLEKETGLKLEVPPLGF